MLGGADYSPQPVITTVDPPGFASLQNTMEWGWQFETGWGRNWKGDLVAGSTLGEGTLTLTAMTAQGQATATAKIQVVTWIQVLPRTQENVVVPGALFTPIMAVGKDVIGTAGVPQGLIWETMPPFADGSLLPPDATAGRDSFQVQAPTIPGVYQLKATALAAPGASGIYTFTVR